MVRFPEQDPRQLPEFPLTSTQQRWKSKQTEALTARRTWKSTQMALVALCMPFKTFIVREFGEDYLAGMMKEFESVDIGATNSATFSNAIKVLTGPDRDLSAPSADDPDYEMKLAQYEVDVEQAKSYVGLAMPDAETASRIVTLVVKLRNYEASALEAEMDSVQLAINSLCNAEIPTAGLLRSVAANAVNYKDGVVSDPIDFAQFGTNNDDPSTWQGTKAFHRLLVTPWLKGYKKQESIGEEYATYVRFRNNPLATAAEKSKYSWTWVFRLYCERVFNIKFDKFGYYREHQGGRFYVGPALLFYAKAYGRMADPLQFWSTHSKYRLHATNMGSRGVVVELSEVDARIGAPSGKTVAIATFSSGTTGSAVATVKAIFPYLMDVEEGNNPTLDKFIGESIAQRQIAQAGAEFAKQPASARAGYRYVACTKTVLAFPGTILYHPEWDTMVMSSANINPLLKEDNPAFQMWTAYSKRSNSSAYSRYAVTLRDKITGIDAESTYHNFLSGPLKVEHSNRGMDGNFSWNGYFDNRGIDPLIKQCVLGVPSPHKDARVITTLTIALVPAHFDAAIREIEKALQGAAGSTEKKTWRVGGRVTDVPTDEWTNLSNALIALTSGHWAMEGSWLRTGDLRKDYGYNTMFSTMGIPVTTTFTARQENANVNLRGAIDVLKQYGLWDLSGVKTVFEGAVNDLDDIANVVSDFKKAYPDISELVMPDTSDPNNLVIGARSLHTNVTSLSVAPIVNIPKIANGEYGSYMVRRIPINTKGVSGKTYRFGDRSSAMSNLMLSTNTYDMQVPGGMSGVGVVAGVSGLMIAGMLTYAGYKAISN